MVPKGRSRIKWWQGQLNFAGLNATSIIFMLILGIVHTGLGYFLYFTSLQKLKGQTIAVLSYIDPISAAIIAAIFLGVVPALRTPPAK